MLGFDLHSFIVLIAKHTVNKPPVDTCPIQAFYFKNGVRETNLVHLFYFCFFQCSHTLHGRLGRKQRNSYITDIKQSRLKVCYFAHAIYQGFWSVG